MYNAREIFKFELIRVY